MRRDVTFSSDGSDLKGWFYTPDGAPPFAVVLMTHGFSATRRGMTVDKFAEVFRESGLAVLLYDHPGFGDSGGEPRRQINPWKQARGYRDAISYVSGLDEVDPDRIGLWGDSLSGAAALAIAGIDPRVAALAVQVPAVGAALPPEDPEGALYRALKETILSGDVEPSHDEVEGPMPVVSDDQVRRPSALTPITAYRWFMEYGSRPGTGWVNQVTRARPKTAVAWHAGLCAAHVSCPALFVVAPEDEMTGAVPAVARHAYDNLAGPKQWLDVDGGHFGLLYYPSAEFDRSSSAQADFLAACLMSSDGVD